MSKKNQTFTVYFKKTFWNFIEHVTITKKILLSTIYEFVFWLLFFGISYCISRILKREASILTTINFSQQQLLSTPTLAQANITLIKTFVAKSVLVLLLFITLELIAYTIIKGLIWLTLLGKKPTKEYFKKFFTLTLLWWITWIIPILFLFAGIQPDWRQATVITLFLLYLHFTTLLQTLFTKKTTIKETFSATFSTGIGKLHYFILPYTFSTVIYLLLTRILIFFPPTSTLMLTIAIAIGLLFISWFRNYVKDIILMMN